MILVLSISAIVTAGKRGMQTQTMTIIGYALCIDYILAYEQGFMYLHAGLLQPNAGGGL